jgi:hypothetical protein
MTILQVPGQAVSYGVALLATQKKRKAKAILQ